jgi:bifunctional NMN adenylyltransferase/nudix hydrolase
MQLHCTVWLKESKMTNKKYDTLVFLCRVQPVHNAHVALIERAASLANQVIIIIGSANQPRTYKNPFSACERGQMLSRVVIPIMKKHNIELEIKHNTDSIYNDQAWASRVQKIVTDHAINSTGKIGIIGHKKDMSSSYLDMFPQWALEEVELFEPLNATDIRDLYFQRWPNLNFIRSVVPAEVVKMLESFKETTEFRQIVDEREFADNYKKQYAGLAYPPIFVTADALIVCSGHVLMIQRRAMPGKGLWALPGGYVNANTDKSVQDAMIRELREETGIKVPVPVLIGSIIKSQVFDSIDRSPRGRIITHCFRIDLPVGPLPRVKGGDDAAKAQWVPIADIKSETCFEDHDEIIHNMLGY